MSSKVLSPKRQEILSFVENFTGERGYPPSVREIAEGVGLRSASTVHSHLKILEENGYLTHGVGKTRTLSLRDQTPVRQVPVIGNVRAGSPILAYEETTGTVPYGGRAGGELFGLTVQGDSMRDAAILEGDVVIVKRQQSADSGQIVVALLEDEATVKRLRIDSKSGHVWLMPENPSYSPIDGDGCSILGVVVAVYREHVS